MTLHTASTTLHVEPADVKILGGNTLTGERVFIQVRGRRYNCLASALPPSLSAKMTGMTHRSGPKR